jgi:hypothetical protein
MWVYQAGATACNACLLQAQCPTSVRGRTLKRGFAGTYPEEAQAHPAAGACEKAMCKRPVWVEPLFAEAKDCLGPRGLLAANIQGLSIAAVQYLKRFLAAS